MENKIRAKDLIATLQMFPPDMQVFISNDELWNTDTLFNGFEATMIEVPKNNNGGSYEACLIYPLENKKYE